MCLAVPGRITDLHDGGGIAMATVDYGGITREACMAYLPEAQIGDYVLVHVGFAITRVDEEEAARTLAMLREMGELAELEESGGTPGGGP
jgi:hydrogenase expression/formation protein HypC